MPSLAGALTIVRRPVQDTPIDILSPDDIVVWLRSGGVHPVGGGQLIWEGLDGYGQQRNHFFAQQRAPLITSFIDGNAGLAFDATQKQVLRCPHFTGVAKGDKPCVLVVASVYSDGPAGTPTMLYLSGKSPLTATYVLFDLRASAAAGAACVTRLGSGGTQSSGSVGGAQWADGTPRLFMGIAANASDRAEIWIDGALRGTAAAGAAGGLFATPTHAVIGSTDEGGSGTRWMDGVIGEVLVLKRALSPLSLIALYERWYAVKWPTIYAGLP